MKQTRSGADEWEALVKFTITHMKTEKEMEISLRLKYADKQRLYEACCCSFDDDRETLQRRVDELYPGYEIDGFIEMVDYFPIK